MSRVYASHPTDRVARACAPTTDSGRLTDEYEHIIDVVAEHRGKTGAYGAMQALCSLTIARVQLLEEMLLARSEADGKPTAGLLVAASPRVRRPVTPRTVDERRAREKLYKRTGNVIALPVGRGAGDER